METSTAAEPNLPLTESCEDAFFDGKVVAVAAAFYENERPLQGLVGILDWRLRGAISVFLKQNRFTGQMSEIVYLPVLQSGRVYHLLLLGRGQLDPALPRTVVTKSELGLLKKNVVSMKFPSLGLSKSDLGGISATSLNQVFQDVTLWIGP